MSNSNKDSQIYNFSLFVIVAIFETRNLRRDENQIPRNFIFYCLDSKKRKKKTLLDKTIVNFKIFFEYSESSLID